MPQLLHGDRNKVRNSEARQCPQALGIENLDLTITEAEDALVFQILEDLVGGLAGQRQQQRQLLLR
ncbi:hypothetical protein D3C75_1185800 [compost metagenome]